MTSRLHWAPCNETLRRKHIRRVENRFPPQCPDSRFMQYRACPLGFSRTPLPLSSFLPSPSCHRVRIVNLCHSLMQPTPVLVPGRANVHDLGELLKRVPAGMRRWTWEKEPRTKNSQVRKWSIDNEYHVQNLLYVLLSPLFPDLSDEQYLDQVGQKNPLSDLLIPSIKLILELKFQREGHTLRRSSATCS
jgi:hypothetical protein